MYYSDDLNNKMYLTDSSANSTVKFSAGGLITGEISGATANIVSLDNYSIDQFVPKLSISSPDDGNVHLTYAMSYSNGSQYLTSGFNDLNLDTQNDINYNAVIRSRSLEVDSSYLYGSRRKSAVIKAKLDVATSNNSIFNSPIIDGVNIDVFMTGNKISNTYTSVDANSVTYDTEVYVNGNALCKAIDKKITFANNRFAEDVRVYINAYRPQGTDIKIYAKIHNSSDQEVFDDKLWTPLELKENANVYSSSIDSNNLFEYTYGFPSSPDAAVTLPGSYIISNNSTTVLSSGGTPSTYLAANDLVKFYDPVFPTNYFVTVVESANTSAIVVKNATTNNSIIGSGFVAQRMLYNQTAYNDSQNYGIVKYHNSAMSEFDKYDSLQIKIVLLSDNTYSIPKVDTIEVIGVSA